MRSESPPGSKHEPGGAGADDCDRRCGGGLGAWSFRVGFSEEGAGGRRRSPPDLTLEAPDLTLEALDLTLKALDLTLEAALTTEVAQSVPLYRNDDARALAGPGVTASVKVRKFTNTPLEAAMLTLVRMV
eukprot:5387750-Pyramimonas_sp.AAC.2